MWHDATLAFRQRLAIGDLPFRSSVVPVDDQSRAGRNARGGEAPLGIH
jgi:hypothetical protein